MHGVWFLFVFLPSPLGGGELHGSKRASFDSPLQAKWFNLSSQQFTPKGGRVLVSSCSLLWADLREDRQINTAPDFLVDFRPSGAHGGPQETRRWLRFKKWCRLGIKSELETKSKAQSWANYDCERRQTEIEQGAKDEEGCTSRHTLLQRPCACMSYTGRVDGTLVH